MGVLKVKVGAAWVEIPGVGGPSAGVVQSGSYTPTLTSLVVGTGGTNTADYTFVGGPNVGDKGLLAAQGKIVFGSSGATFPTVNSRIGLPSGFNLNPNTTTWHIGTIRGVIPGQNGWEGVLGNDSASPGVFQLSFGILGTGNSIQMSPASSTFPFTWAATHEIRWMLNVGAVRI